MTDSKKPEKKNKSAWRFFPLIIIITVIALFYLMGWGEYLSVKRLSEFQQDSQNWIEANWLLSIGLFIGLYTSLVAISFPGASFLTLASGMLFGLWWGTGATVIGATLGATLIFLLARSSLGGFLRDRASGFLAKLRDGFERQAGWYLLSLRLVPLVPFWVLNIVAGAMNMRVAPYIFATFFGIIPGSFIYVSIGNGAGEVLARGKDFEIQSLFTQPQLFLPLIGLALLSLLPVLAGRFIKVGKHAE